MMTRLSYAPYTLNFNFDARTSRGSMTQKPTYFVRAVTGQGVAYGECAVFPGLSPEWGDDYADRLAQACREYNATGTLAEGRYPSSIMFGIESATAMLPPVPPCWARGDYGLLTNGLIWMGDYDTMRQRIDDKLAQGFTTLKLKIGGIDFDNEVDLLRMIRRRYSAADVALRLDANGSFTVGNALERLQQLAAFDIDSLEQPIKAGQPEAMAALCRHSPIDIMLDEELIGTRTPDQQRQLLDAIAPQGIILKPTLCGGYAATLRWLALARERGMRVWVTSALESNVGLYYVALLADVVAQTAGTDLPQGLGTGHLFTNNIPSGIRLEGQYLYNNPEVALDMLAITNWIEP